MKDYLSIWRSPLDRVALQEAQALRDQQPRCSITIEFNTPFNPTTAYNFGSYAGVPGGGTPAQNSTYLQQMLNDMLDASPPIGIGGFAFIPQSQFGVYASTDGIAVPGQVNVVGSGGGGLVPPMIAGDDFFHFVINLDGTFLTCSGGHTSAGQYFRSLAFQWLNPTDPTDRCIVANTWNCRAVECNFVDCPTAFAATGLQSGLIGCTIAYTAGPDDATAVILQGGTECFIHGPGEFYQTSVAAGGPAGCSAIALGGGSPTATEHAVITDLHLYNWSFAINYVVNRNVYGTHVTNVEAAAYVTCVNMIPPGANGKIHAEKFTSCVFRKTADSTDGHAIILVGTSLGPNSNLNDIEFRNCTVYSDSSTPQAGQYCYEITSGENIRIIGGTIGNAGASGQGGAGIAITAPTGGGGPGRITILGVDLSAKYPHADNVHAQQYALLISASLQDVVTVEDCKMAGYEDNGNPVSVTGEANEYLYIRNCQGYNDLNTPLNHGVAPLGPGFTRAATCTTPYFGPSLISFSNSSPVSLNIFGAAITRSAGVFYLPSPYDGFFFETVPSFFSWVGK